MRPARALIDLQALRHNYRIARELSGARALAVVKADAYGHGAVRCAQALEAEADGFAVACIEEALALLGVVQLRSLVSSAPLGTTSRSVPGVNLQQFWRYSLNTAKLARSLAGLVHHNQIAAYTAGLLHAVGELLLHLADPETVLSINTLVSPLDLRRAKIEQRILGYCYGNVSAGLAQRWQFPDVVVEALQHQSAPLDNNVYEPLAGVIHLASWRARAREADLGEKEMAVSFPGEVGLMLGLDIDMVLQQDPIDWTARPEASDYVV